MIPDLYVRVQPGADALEEGYFLLLKAHRDRVDVPVRIWFGPPEDPDQPGVVLDRAPRWQIEINGILLGDPDDPPLIAGRPVTSLEGVWPEARLNRTDRADYDYRVARADHAEQHDPNDPFGDTAGRIDPLTASLPLWD